MLDSMRKPFFIFAIFLMVLTVLLELGTAFILNSSGASSEGVDAPGYGIPYLALLDGLLLYSVLSMAATLIIPERIYGRIQGILTFIISLIILIAAIVMIFIALALLILMVCLFMAPPFGTLIYLGAYASFPKSDAAAMLATIMTFKFAFVILLMLAHQGFLGFKSFLLMVLTSFVATIIISFLHALVPGFLVSISDDIAAIVVAILAAIWAIIYLIGSIPAIVKALRMDRALR